LSFSVKKLIAIDGLLKTENHHSTNKYSICCFWIVQVGLAIKPATSVESIVKYVSFVDTLLVMTVEPGFGGQKFMHDMMPKVFVLF